MRPNFLCFPTIVALSLLLAPVPTEAQQPGRIPRIGVLAPLAPPPAPNPDVDGFRRGLAELGYVEGQNIKVEYRWEAGLKERQRELVTELVQLPVDVLVVTNESRARVVKELGSSTPVVLAVAGDPVAAGLATSLARPGGNITGLSMLTAELCAKRVALLKEMMPALTTVAVFSGPNARQILLRETEDAAHKLGVQVVPIRVENSDGLDAAFRTAKRARATAVITIQDPFFAMLSAPMAQTALRNGLATMSGEPGSVEAGSLMRYGPSIPDLWRRAAAYVDKILKGAQPAELPIQQATKFELVINMRTAKALRLTVPQSLLIQADETLQ